MTECTINLPLRLEFSLLTRRTTSLISDTARGTHVSHLALHVAATLQGTPKHHGHARKCPGQEWQLQGPRKGLRRMELAISSVRILQQTDVGSGHPTAIATTGIKRSLFVLLQLVRRQMVMGLFAVSAILLGRTFKSVPGCTAISKLTGAYWHEGASILLESMLSGDFL